MKSKKQLSPDAPTGNTGASVPPSIKKVRLIPRKNADMLSLAQSVNTKWAATPALTLLWITQPQFATMVGGFDTNLANRLQVGSGQQAKTQTLAQLNKTIDTAVTDVKTYIEKKFKKANAPANFSRYGIVVENSTYRLPKDNDKRLLALPLMVAAIAADGFGTEEYGTVFWTTALADFKTALGNTTTTAKGISNKVAAKDTDIENITKVINSIIKLIEANYPDTVDTTLREWGFLKQNY